MQLIHYISPTLLKCCLIFLIMHSPLLQPKMFFICNYFMPFNAAHCRVFKSFTN